MNRGAFVNGVKWFFPEDHAHIRAYKDAVDYQRWFYPTFTAPEWVDLSEEQRARIRAANEEHWKGMREFGEELRKTYE